MRSYSMPVHHLLEDSDHVVALTSTTLGSLELVHMDLADESQKGFRGRVDAREKEGEEVMDVVREGKAWSDMIEEKIPKFIARARTPGSVPPPPPPGEPEIINVMELMEGLDDSSSMRPQKHFRSFTFDIVRSPDMDTVDHPVAKLPEIEEARRKSVDLAAQENEKNSSWVKMNGVQPAVELDPESTSASKISTVSSVDRTHVQPRIAAVPDYKCSSFGKDKVIVYFTSLRGVRKTYEDCLHVRLVLKGLGLRVDEPDLSMHSGFKDNLKQLMGDAFRGAALPRVFIGQKYVAGADKIGRLNKVAQLEKVFQGTDGNKVCGACGDAGFLPCESCSGSCKIYYDRHGYADGELNEADSDGDGDGFGFGSCPDCNENGLIRCPICCY